MNMVTSLLNRYAADPSMNFSSELRSLVESFSEKDKMELMAINSNGKVLITSSGFSPLFTEKIPDFEEALNAPSGRGTFTGKYSGGEKIYAVTAMMPAVNSDYAAVRLVVSLENIDKQIVNYVLVVIGVLSAVMLLTLFTGLFFVKSIVLPVRQIGATASRFATGDFSARIVKKNDDEIGELCDIINYMAQELSNAEATKNEFISSVSHELRTPLTAIKGWAETLGEVSDDTQTVKKGIRVIENETDRLSQMVEELLDFSRMQNGRFTLSVDKLDILAELGDAVLIYTQKASREGIKMVYTEPEMLPFVNGDKSRLRQVFINIIDNAIKYSDSGGTVSILAEQIKDRIKITVSDTGCGISAEDLPKVKTKFYKANHTRRGSGIGLAVANEIVNMHKGTLEIISELGVGTTVTITLPTVLSKQENQPVSEERKV